MDGNCKDGQTPFVRTHHHRGKTEVRNAGTGITLDEDSIMKQRPTKKKRYGLGLFQNTNINKMLIT